MKNINQVSDSKTLHPSYRPDIDGLRAVAILAVVGFHAFPQSIRGGFVGVDVFFVISGFLISSLIFQNLDIGTFSFRNFYARRICRIFPALIVVLASCLGLGWFVLLADEYAQLGKHTAAAAAFITNFIFWQEAGYFDNAADTKPLLHLWSLGIEEQFYMIWPLFLYGAWRKKLNLLSLVMVIAVASFVLNIAHIHMQPDATFYSPVTRFWELLAGSLLAHLSLYPLAYVTSILHWMDSMVGAALYRTKPVNDGRTLRDVSSLLGLTLILVTIFMEIKCQLFPGWMALLPVTGSFLLIAAGAKAWVNRIILSRRMLVGIGLISYPLYLWHWPLLSFARIVNDQTPPDAVLLGLVIASFLLAWATYILIENYFRFGGGTSFKVIVLILCMVFLGITGLALMYGQGMPEREFIKWNEAAATITLGEGKDQVVPECDVAEDKKSLFQDNCFKDKREASRYAVVGDSKGYALYWGLARDSLPHERWMMLGTFVPVISDSAVYRTYKEKSELALDAVIKDQNIKLVLLVAAKRAIFRLSTDYKIDDLPDSPYLPEAFQGLDLTVKKLTAARKQVVLLVDNPTLRDPKSCIPKRLPTFMGNLSANEMPGCFISYKRYKLLSQKYTELIDDLKKSNPSLTIYDPTSLLCDIRHDVCGMVNDDHYQYSFADHISDYSNDRIAKELVLLVHSLAGGDAQQ